MLSPLNSASSAARSRIACRASAASPADSGQGGTGGITFIDLSTNAPSGEQPFAATAGGWLAGVSAVGNHIVAESASGFFVPSHHVFDRAGKLTDHRDGHSIYWRPHEWAPHQSRVYIFLQGYTASSVMLGFTDVDQGSGTLTGTWVTPHHGETATMNAIRVSPDGKRLALTSGDLFDTADFKIVGSVRDPNLIHTDMQWLGDGSLVSLQSHANGSGGTVLRLYDSTLSLQQERKLEGMPVALFRLGTSGLVVVTRAATNKLQFQRLNF